MASSDYSISVELNGPLFHDLKRGRAVDKFMRAVVKDVTLTGEGLVKEQLYPGHGKITGHYQRSIIGEVRGESGKIHDSNVVYGPWLEGVSFRNSITRFKGYAMFRNAAQRLQRTEVPRIIKRRIKALVGDLT